MAGNKVGGKLAAEANQRKTRVTIYGRDVEIEPGTMYKVIGKIGGQNGHTGGFWARRDIARSAGRLGGLKSRRGPKKV